MTGYRNAGSSLAHAIWPAVFAAGPVFLTAAALATLYLELPNAIEIAPQAVLVYFVMLVPAALVGAFLSVLPVVIAAGMLDALASRVPALRSPVVWAAVGAVAGSIIADVAGSSLLERETRFALILTATLSALWARRGLYADATIL